MVVKMPLNSNKSITCVRSMTYVFADALFLWETVLSDLTDFHRKYSMIQCRERDSLRLLWNSDGHAIPISWHAPFADGKGCCSLFLFWSCFITLPCVLLPWFYFFHFYQWESGILVTHRLILRFFALQIFAKLEDLWPKTSKCNQPCRTSLPHRGVLLVPYTINGRILADVRCYQFGKYWLINDGVNKWQTCEN